MRNAILAVLAVGLLAANSLALPFVGNREGGLLKFRQAEPPQAAPIVKVAEPPVGQISGPAKLVDDADTVYTVLCLPRNYKSCAPCMATLNAFNRDAKLIDLRSKTRYYVLVEGTPEFTPAWAARVPEVKAGHTVALLTQGAYEIAREVSPNLIGFGDRFRKKFCDKICPDCEPEEPVDPPAEEPDTTIVPPVVPPIEPADDEPNQVALLATALGVGFIVWLAVFKRAV